MIEGTPCDTSINYYYAPAAVTRYLLLIFDFLSPVVYFFCHNRIGTKPGKKGAPPIHRFSRRMKKINVESIEPDMILARDVSSTSGNVLLGKGTPLTPALGRRLKNWGIFFVYIDGEEESEVVEAAVKISPDEVRQELEKKFEGTLDEPVMRKVFNAVFEFKMRSAGTPVRTDS